MRTTRLFTATFALFTAIALFSGCTEDDPIDNPNGNNNPSADDTPTAVMNLTATAGNAQVFLTWDEPTDNGNSEFTGYELTIDDWANKVSKAANELTHTYTNLTNGTQYTFKVRAINAKGAGTESTVTATPTESESQNGTWIVQNTPFGESGIADVVFGNGKFVAVGGNGKIAHSEDGVTWTAAANTTFPSNHMYDNRSYGITSVAYGLVGGNTPTFVATGPKNKIAYSTDGGITWTAANNAAIVGYNDDAYVGGVTITYCGNKFVACGERIRKEEVGISYDMVMGYSTDGITWTDVTDKLRHIFIEDQYTPPYLYDVASDGNNTLVVLGYSGTSPSYANRIAYSTDNGESWQEVIEAQSMHKLVDITYGNGRFVAVGLRRIVYSSNGINWTQVPTDDTGLIYTENVVCVAYCNNKFIAGGGSLIYSPNGEKWTNIPYEESEVALYGIAYGVGTTVAVGSVGFDSYLMYCKD